MKRIIKGSAGDVKLYKALIFETPKTDLTDFDKYYVDEIQAYVFIWSYTYNRNTGQGASGAQNHRDIRNKLPAEIRQGEQYDLMLDVDNSGVYLHDRYGTPQNIQDYILKEFKQGNENVDF